MCSIFPKNHYAVISWTFLPILPGVAAMPNPASPVLDLAAPITSQAADPTHLLDLFRRLLPPDAVDDVASGNATLFTPWLVIWLMVWQRSQGNTSLGEAVAEIDLGPTFNDLPDCKRV